MVSGFKSLDLLGPYSGGFSNPPRFPQGFLEEVTEMPCFEPQNVCYDLALGATAPTLLCSPFLDFLVHDLKRPLQARITSFTFVPSILIRRPLSQFCKVVKDTQEKCFPAPSMLSHPPPPVTVLSVWRSALGSQLSHVSDEVSSISPAVLFLTADPKFMIFKRLFSATFLSQHTTSQLQ